MESQCDRKLVSQCDGQLWSDFNGQLWSQCNGMQGLEFDEEPVSECVGQL